MSCTIMQNLLCQASLVFPGDVFLSGIWENATLGFSSFSISTVFCFVF